ncbi:DNA mismatch repair protein MutH [Weissella cibaria]|uniref:DNA mismatch repair protein MutH n=1 Tax=Weissella cibaria TaxID=137591 RepID=UPI00106DDB93|nr:DNA mismatch repair protein MutH [Weissella cibaria]MBZ5942440.1 DNA mismatch repair protein MutH [Weissella cibaria]MCB5826973.1 DNA mismatch repair protein MutH [Weissella cibaria]MCB5858554.1 DNA mismatch repair protein MutH [Weissella cibaria]MCB5860763.1 DNA mismatch repair protein MutH [Weissella cibaria]MCB5862379.1 DNA mismatch repair protein MutH [Weissella cibaria]
MYTEDDINKAQKELDVRVAPFIGKTVEELIKTFLPKEEKKTKASFPNLARAMLSITSNKVLFNNRELNATLKTVRLSDKDKPVENMSFMPIDFDEWCTASSWQSCGLYNYFTTTALVFVVFKQHATGRNVADNLVTFEGAKIMMLPQFALDYGLQEVWNEVRRLIMNNELELKTIVQSNGKKVVSNNFPSTKFNGIAHLRPGGRNGDDKVELPSGQMIAKQRLWLNAGFIGDLVKDVVQ